MISEELMRKVADFIEMEQRSCSMSVMTAEYIARCLQISREDAEEVLVALRR